MKDSNNDLGVLLRAVESEIRRGLSDLDTGKVFQMDGDKAANVRKLAVALYYELTGNEWKTPEWARK